MDSENKTELSSGRYLYGDKRTPEIVLTAVRTFGRPVSASEVRDFLAHDMPEFNVANVAPDLSKLSVNCHSRGHYNGNGEPRRSDSGNPNDSLYKAGARKGARYTLYDSSEHGVWLLADGEGGVLRPRLLHTSDQEALALARGAAKADARLDFDQDLRKWIIAGIVQREGQPAFRKALLEAYDGRCAISDCAMEDVLEAAHIAPYRGVPTNVVGNGLLLRADLHKLFDLDLIAIDVDTRIVRLSGVLLQSEYARFEGVRLRDPVDPSMAPLEDALLRHRDRCVWLNAGDDGAPQEERDE